MGLKKGSTFHSPKSQEPTTFRPPSLPRRSQTSLDDVIGANRRRAAIAIGDIEHSLNTFSDDLSRVLDNIRDDSLPLPLGLLHHTVDSSIMAEKSQGRALRSRTRRTSRQSDSGLGSSIRTSTEKQSVKASALTRSAAAAAASTTDDNFPALSERATNRIVEHVLRPLLAKPAFKDFHSLVLECPRKIKENEIVCLRDVEKTLLLVAPVSQDHCDKGAKRYTYRVPCLKETSRTKQLYLDFSLTTVRCIQATVEYLTDRELTRERDLPYTSGYFLDLVGQIQQYAQQLAKSQVKGGASTEMHVDSYVGSVASLSYHIANLARSTDEVKLHGGLLVNGKPAELVRVTKDGKAFSLATGQPIDVIDEEVKESARIKRSLSEQLEDDESIMRSMARRKKNATPEELAPKKCREPGCNKEFKRPCDLTKHEKTHSRPWKCPVVTCKYHEYGWPTEKEMDRHHNDKHSAAPPMYHCLYNPCPYKSKRQSNCKQHMEKAHGWTYVRTKTNGKKGSSVPGGSVTQSTPQLHNLPTPEYSPSIQTPLNDPTANFPLFGDSSLGNLDFPVLDNHFEANYDMTMIPQDLHLEPDLDFMPLDNPTPSTDSGADRNSAYQDIGNDFTLDEDIYAATVQLPPNPLDTFYAKGYVPPQQFGTLPASDMIPLPSATHLSPIGQGNTMLYTPSSMVSVDDEGFIDGQNDFNAGGMSGDFLLYPESNQQKPMAYSHSLFPNTDVSSLAAGYSQPSTQEIMNALQNLEHMDWSTETDQYLSSSI